MRDEPKRKLRKAARWIRRLLGLGSIAVAGKNDNARVWMQRAGDAIDALDPLDPEEKALEHDHGVRPEKAGRP
jgi:hypothetical protein